MAAIGQVSVSLGIFLAWMILLRGRREFRGTTLVTVEIWSFLTATAWTSTWIADRCLGLPSAALADHLWYGCAIVSLCPPIAVLGSRRPGTRVWTWFILLPMLLTLSWPIAAVWFQGSELRGVHLETPQLIAVCLVIVMGVGNYCGTIYTVSALLYGGAILALVICSSAKTPSWLGPREATRFWCTAAMTLSILLLKTSHRPAAATKFDRLWFDFFDMFGIVWGRRIQDRVNAIASNERLPVRLELHGFVWSSEAAEKNNASPPLLAREASADARSTSPPNAAASLDTKNESPVEARVYHILRWLLRRFVDPEWISERLGSKSGPDFQDTSVDS